MAQVGTVGYTSLQAAIDAAPEGGTVTLLKSIIIESGDAEQNSAAIIIENSITLDGSGNSITVSDGFGNTSVINVVNSGTVTIKDLTVNGTANSVSGSNSRHCINIFSSESADPKSTVILENVVTTGGLTGVTIGGSNVIIRGEDTNIANGTWDAAIAPLPLLWKTVQSD